MNVASFTSPRTEGPGHGVLTPPLPLGAPPKIWGRGRSQPQSRGPGCPNLLAVCESVSGGSPGPPEEGRTGWEGRGASLQLLRAGSEWVFIFSG